MSLFKYILRELINNRRFSLLFILNLSIGLAGFIALDGYKVSLDQTIRSRSKILLGADLGMSARRPLKKKEVEVMTSLLGKDFEPTDITEVFSMVVNQEGRSRLVQIRAIEDNYPFYGVIERQSQSSKSLNKNNKDVWAHPEVLTQLNVKVGDSLKIGEAEFIIADVVTADSASGFTSSVAPRIYMNHEQLKLTDLVQKGSLVRYTKLFKAPNRTNSEVTEISNEAFTKIESPEVKVFTHEKSSEQLAGLISTLNDFLGLASLVALFLAAIGSVFLVRSYFVSKVDQMAILMSLGLSPNLSLVFYLTQIFILGLCSALVAGAIAIFLVPVLGGLTQGLLPFDISFIIRPSTFFLGLVVGSLGSVLICLPLAVSLRRIKPSRLLTKQNDLQSQVMQVSKGSFFNRLIRSSWFLQTLASLPGLLLFWFLAVKLSNSLKIGSIFTLMFLGSGLILGLVSVLVFSSSVLYRNVNSLSLKWALRDLIRDRWTTTVCFVSIGMGVLLLNLVPQIQKAVQADLQNPEQSLIPSYFMFDIQEEQLEELKSVAKSQNTKLEQISPTIRARLMQVNGKDFSKMRDELVQKKRLTQEQQAEARSRNRGYNLSYRDRLDSSETITKGRPFSGRYQESESGEGDVQSLPEISLEKRFAENLNLNLKDVLTFEIDGVPIDGVVVNFRSVKWTSFQPNYFVQFQPGSLDMAPKTFVATAKSKNEDEKIKFQDAVVSELPNISIIDVSRVIQRIVQITSQVVWALQFMSLLCFIAGLVVIYSIANHQTSMRTWDIGLLKSLGASFSTIRNQFLWQFCLISALATIVGIAISFVASYLISSLIFETTWQVSWLPPTLSLIGCTLLTLAVTYLATNKSLKTKTIELFF